MSSSQTGPPIDPLDRQLHELPVVRASSGFTQRVLRRLDEPASASSAVPPAQVLWGGLGISLLLITAIALLPEAPSDLVPNLTAEATEIRRQHALLSEELERLRSRAEDAAPVLYLGSDDEVDYVLDLSPFLLPQTGGVMPASNSNPASTF